MARGGATRFQPGQSGNPGGRPKARRPHVSAFDIIIDQTLKVTQGGVERELSIDEALELQTYQAALGGSRMAIRRVLKMIEKRELALARKVKPKPSPVKLEMHHTSDNAQKAMHLLGIAEQDPDFGGVRFKLHTWAAQAAISRPGRKVLDDKDQNSVKFFTFDADKLRWPKGGRREH
jgi:hypothetical protein